MVIGAALSITLWWTRGTLFGITLIDAGPVGHLVTGLFSASAAWFVTVVVSMITGGEKDERILREVDRIHGWQNYDPRRYNGKLFPGTVAVLALLIMIWSAMPNRPFDLEAAGLAPPPASVAAQQQ